MITIMWLIVCGFVGYAMGEHYNNVLNSVLIALLIGLILRFIYLIIKTGGNIGEAAGDLFDGSSGDGGGGGGDGGGD